MVDKKKTVRIIIVRTVQCYQLKITVIWYQFVCCSLPKNLPVLEGVLDVNNNLTHTERLFEGQVTGPESIAVDSTGNELTLIFYLPCLFQLITI